MVISMLGQKLGGRYQICQQLQKGGFGFTFIGEDMQRPGNPKCVVKHLKPRVNDPDTLREAQRLFQKEAEIQEHLGNHDQIPRLLARFEENQEFYLVQEFIEGHDLSAELPLGHQLSEAYVIKLLQEILEVLAFVHQHGVIHRDIKPSNIRRRRDGKIVLIDFGAVKQISTQIINSHGESDVTISIGTPGYMPSEQANGNPQFSSDVYAVGIIGIQALTGISPVKFIKDAHTYEIIWRHQADVSSELADVLDKMVCYDFRQRYPSADEALQALSELPLHNTTKRQHQTQNQTTRFPSFSTNSSTPIQPLPQSNKLLFQLLITAVVTASVIFLFYFRNPKPTVSWYENHNYGIKIKYPQNWELQKINNPITGEIVAFLSPRQSNTDSPEKLTISVEDFSGTLDEFRDSSIKDIKNHMKDAKIINTTSTLLSHKSANQLVFTGKDGKNRLKNLQIFTLEEDKAYVITYTAQIENYDEFVRTAETMIKSFEIQ